jgi:ABC-type branched-subunit amino acid transport system substrate-binding protein
MKNNKRLTLWVSIIFVLVLSALPFLTSCSSNSSTTTANSSTTTSAAQPLELKIGVMSCLTGWFAQHDLLEWQELQMVAQYINDNGGVTIKGQQYNLKLVVEDYQSTDAGCTTAANKLISEGMEFVIGPNAYFPADVGKIFADAKVLDVIAYNTLTPGQLGTDTPYTFQGYDGSLEATDAAASYMVKNYPNVKSVVICMPDDGSIPWVQPAATTLLGGMGIKVLGLVSLDNSATDFSPYATKLASYNADAVFYINGNLDGFGNIMKNLRALGNTNLIAAANNNGVADTITVAGKDAGINFFTESNSTGDQGTPSVTLQIEQNLTAKYGGNREFIFMESNGLYELSQVLNKAQSLDPTVVKTTWESMTTVQTLFGTGNMGGLKTYGINHVCAHPMPISSSDINGKVTFGGWQPVIIP